MLVQRAYVLRCPECQDPIALPHQIPIETIGGLPHLTKGIWPLTYWCENCATLSVHREEDARLVGVEVQAQSPYAEILWVIEFECGPEGYEKQFSIYTKRLAIPLEDGAAQRVIGLSGLCEGFPLRRLRTSRFLPIQ
jgi:hypothetical protein